MSTKFGPRSQLHVVWFRHGHEQRNDLLRFGMMRLHRAEMLSYREYPLACCTEFGFPSRVAKHTHRHTSVLAIVERGIRVRCVVDNEDSFFCMSPLIEDADLYFCAGYNSDFFVHKKFNTTYRWQKESDVAYYRRKAKGLIDDFGRHFHVVRKFVPIGPNMARTRPLSYLPQRWRNLKYRIHRAVSSTLYTASEFAEFEARYGELLALRSAPLMYDVVLADTLWGWPRHRYALHRKLSELSIRYAIHSELKWEGPNVYDGSAEAPLDAALFPLCSGRIEGYERMLASSRLGVFASGYHWGWRNIMTLALMVGLPVYVDRPRLEPWFDLGGFELFFNDDAEWPDLELHLQAIDEARWNEIKARNQRYFDKVMSPEAVARYVVDTALAR